MPHGVLLRRSTVSCPIEALYATRLLFATDVGGQHVAKSRIYRNHTAVKFSAGLMRVAAVITLIGALVAGILTVINSATRFIPTLPGFGGIAILVVGVIYGLVFWATADVFILLADGDDAHRDTHTQLASLRSDLAALQGGNLPPALPDPGVGPTREA